MENLQTREQGVGELELEEIRHIIEDLQASGPHHLEEITAVLSGFELTPEQLDYAYELLSTSGAIIIEPEVGSEELPGRKKYTPAQIIELAKRIERGDPRAREEMVQANYGLVTVVANKYKGRGLEMDDLIQEGFIGLHGAIEKFDWRRGKAFSTYAYYWIHTAIKDAIDNQARTIRTPIHIAKQRRSLQRVQRELAASSGNQPTLQEVAEAAGVSAEQAEKALGAAKADVSLDAPMFGKDEPGGLIDTIADETSPASEDEWDPAILRQVLDVAKLSDRYRQIIELRFGLSGEPPKTLEETGRIFGISREAVRLQEVRALRQLRQSQEVKVVLGLELPPAAEDDLGERDKKQELEADEATAESSAPVVLNPEEIEAEVIEMSSRGFSDGRIALEIDLDGASGVLEVKRLMFQKLPPKRAEARVRKLTKQGLSNKQIGQELGIRVPEIREIRHSMLKNSTREEFEIEIMRLVARGLDSSAIGRELGIKPEEAVHIKTEIAKKFGVRLEELPDIAAGIMMWLEQLRQEDAEAREWFKSLQLY